MRVLTEVSIVDKPDQVNLTYLNFTAPYLTKIIGGQTPVRDDTNGGVRPIRPLLALYCRLWDFRTSLNNKPALFQTG
jgi:hypothetical protein